MAASTPAFGQLDVLRMNDSQVPRERIVPAEGFLLGAQRAVHLLLARVVDGVFVSCQVVGPGEDCVTWLSGRRIDSLALCGLG
jgi:hypothetical protein